MITGGTGASASSAETTATLVPAKMTLTWVDHSQARACPLLFFVYVCVGSDVVPGAGAGWPSTGESRGVVHRGFTTTQPNEAIAHLEVSSGMPDRGPVKQEGQTGGRIFIRPPPAWLSGSAPVPTLSSSEPLGLVLLCLG